MEIARIADNVKRVREQMAQAALRAGRDPKEIALVAATKTNGAPCVRAAIAAGVDACGENRVQELLQKDAEQAYAGAPKHLIGHLQRNKVRQVVGRVDLIESVDSVELLRLLSERAQRLGLTQELLLELNIGGEASKSGAEPARLPELLEAASALPGILVRGLMAIPPVSEKSGANRPYFARMYQLFIDNRREKYNNVSMELLSMGMSGDFQDAILEGANMVRVGSAIFGQRQYGPGG